MRRVLYLHYYESNIPHKYVDHSLGIFIEIERERDLAEGQIERKREGGTGGRGAATNISQLHPRSCPVEIDGQKHHWRSKIKAWTLKKKTVKIENYQIHSGVVSLSFFGLFD